MNRRLVAAALWLALVSLASASTLADPPVGYYRQPAIGGQTIVFVSEGDLWKAPLAGGVATRLTSHPGDELSPAISPDGERVAFIATYEGPPEVYSMPLAGGLPRRHTFDGARASVSGWTPDGRIIASTEVFSTLPNWQLVLIDISTADAAGTPTLLPLAQAADGSYDDAGRTLFFTRLAFQGSHTKRYKGGTAQNIWRFTPGDAEATALTADYAGTSKRPMWWRGRVYFASDRDGTMNIWSMRPDGGDLRQHTRHSGFDVKDPSHEGGRIVYQLGADLHVYDIAADTTQRIEITLDSDLDQTRELWIDKPMDYLTAAHVSPDGERVVLTARGEVFVAPQRQGRLVQVTRAPGVRYRNARFLPDGKELVALSDESGEVELWTLPANGVGAAEQLTGGSQKLRIDSLPSPDGRYLAHYDKDQRLYLFDTQDKSDRLIVENPVDNFSELAWSPDSRWLAYVTPGDNLFRRIYLYDTQAGTITPATTDRYDSYSPAWSADGEWLYFLSDRNLRSIVGSPWGAYQPEPYLDKTTKVYHLALREGLRSPFAPRDELHDENKKGEQEKKETSPQTQPTETQPAETQPAESQRATDAADTQPASAAAEGEKEADKPKVKPVEIELENLAQRLLEVPLPPGNYSDLTVTEKALFWLSRPTGGGPATLSAAAISRDPLEVKTVVEDVRGYELSGDGKKLLIRQGDRFYIVDASAGKADLDKKDVDLSGWKLSVIPQEQWRQMFIEAWRLERDYFYDREMHGVDWPAMRDKYLPLVDRVKTRAELSDLIAQMVGELSALHIFVYGGDQRRGDDNVVPASLGAKLTRDAAAGGYRVDHVYQSDPDEPERTAPLARPGVDIGVGDMIEMVNGVATLSVADINLLLRHQAGRQVLLRVRPAGGGEPRDVIVEPISPGSAADLRYHEWEYTRRQAVEELGEGQIGYVHLRAMGGGNFTEWARNYYPVFTRQGLIIDVRHNRGGNIDSWILGRLLRKAWFYWNQHAGQAPLWNMQYAFRGHVVVLCNERTASDGEAFSEGIKRLKIGTVIGTRTWGGEIWLSSSNFLVDGGIATAAEYGVFGPEGEWLVEGHGVEPDLVVDNLPHETFKGRDAQLEAAVEFLRRKIAEEPVPPVVVPPRPDKSFDYPPPR